MQKSFLKVTNADQLEPLNFPSYDLDIKEQAGKPVVFDEVRRKWVLLLPEEWVRQHVIQFLLRERGYPVGLMAVEKGFQYQGMPQRADIVAHDRQGTPVLMVECKAPGIKIEQTVFDQAARYNQVIRAKYLFVTNGLQHYCCKIDWRSRQYQFVETVPRFGDILE